MSRFKKTEEPEPPKKNWEPEQTEKNEEPEPTKKTRSPSRKKICRLPSPDFPVHNLYLGQSLKIVTSLNIKVIFRLNLTSHLHHSYGISNVKVPS